MTRKKTAAEATESNAAAKRPAKRKPSSSSGKSAPSAKPATIRDRVLGLQSIPKEQIVPDPDNPKIHTPQQSAALAAGLQEIGFTGALLVRKLDAKRFALLDGHERLGHFADGESIRCLLTDLTAEEARKLIATYDTIGRMAGIDTEKLASLVKDVTFDAVELQQLVDKVLAGVDDLVGSAASEPTDAEHVELDAEADEEEGSDESADLADSFRILITCVDEAQQMKLLERFEKEGLECRALIV